MNFIGKVVNCSQPRKGLFAKRELTGVDITVYRSKTLKRGFYDALFLAEMVNIVISGFGGF